MSDVPAVPMESSIGDLEPPPAAPATPDWAELAADPVTPRWLKDVVRFLPVKAQFVLSGNVRDRYPYPARPGEYAPMTLPNFLATMLRTQGYQHFAWYDPVDGFRVVAPRGESEEASRQFFRQAADLQLDQNGRYRCSLARSLEVISRILRQREQFVAVFADLASRYVVRPDQLSDQEHEYFTAALKLGLSLEPHTSAEVPQAMFNPLFWICEQENDLPDWLSRHNPRLREIPLPRPDHVIRRAVVEAITPSLPGYFEQDEAERARHQTEYVEQTEGMAVTDVIAITQLCRREELPFTEIREAVRRYKLGVTEDPWARLDRGKIAQGEDFIRNRVKGQRKATVKALDIIKRAVTGLSGSHGSRAGGRPRGVLFLAGPTGVGKTELAKTLTELLFGDERAYIRFDMSEFSAEHADQRLLGAPPGYVGHSSGGELTNAIREKPFSVVLFDEIEKAHPRILDKFLQLLDDGVLTSGRGERVYFSEAVIIFTSNLGVFRRTAEGERIAAITPQDPYPKVERTIRQGIDNYFKTELNRPEILNRIGENIVVFDFIRPKVAQLIFDKMATGILNRLADRQKLYLSISSEAVAFLHEKCLGDLSNGGRGIGNQLEAWLVNPLARALFEADPPAGSQARVVAISEEDGVPQLRLEER
ncbi:MAG: AAA family ATPase [Verrucomicrobiota bacterium]